MHALAVWLLVLLPAAAPTSAAEPKPLAKAHSHNDYEHARPLLDALEQGFCSVEADIHLVDGQLLVGHDPEDVRPERSLEALYLEPLADRVRRNDGRVFRDGPPFSLLIDLKTDGEATYAVLRQALAKHSEMLTTIRGGKLEPGAVTVVISGNRPLAAVAADDPRYCGVDGRLSDLGALPALELMPWISDNYTQHFTWTGEGPQPEREQAKLRELVQKAHASGRKLRLWATPDTPVLWRAMAEADVDLINTDNLEGLARFLRERN
jgi:glycerophosphoryl diester phosphodiesterase